MRYKILFFSLLFLLSSNLLIAQNRYVAPGGSDTTDCSVDTEPCVTIGYALSWSDPGDIINLALGTYTETFSISTEITIQGEPGDEENTIIQAHENRGDAASRAIFVEETGDLTLANVTVRHGNDPNIGGVGGGGIFNQGGVLTLQNSIIADNNSAARGGGISTDGGGEIILNNTSVIGNIGAGNGGGIWSDGILTIENNSLIEGNESGGTAGGGGIYSNTAETVTISNSAVSGNKSGSIGGGIWQASGSGLYRITDSVIENNEAGSSGGGMYSQGSLEIVNTTISLNETTDAGNGGGIAITSAATITNSEITGNNSDNSGGGIYVSGSGSNLTLVGSLISGNIANNGGGINHDEAVSSLTNVTIAGNHARFGGGGIFNIRDSSPILTNVILWGNRAVSGGDQINNSSLGLNLSQISYSLIEGSGGSGAWDGSLGSNLGNNIDDDPEFTAPELASAAPTDAGNYTTGPTSPVINAGETPADLSIFPGGPADPVDLAENPRVDGAAIDMGAFEFEGDPEVPGAFITTWEVEAGDLSITIPIEDAGYDFTVQWGDGNSTNWEDGDDAGDLTHTYAGEGIYTVEITGDFPRIYFNDAGDKEKILSVEQWGDIEWTSMEGAFYGASNLEIDATDAPDLSGVTSTASMFRGASAMNSNLNHWDVSNVENMSLMFGEAVNFNGDISGWNVSNVNNMSMMFFAALAFDQDIGGWNVSEVLDMSGMFSIASSFNQNIRNWNVSSVTNMMEMFADAILFNQDIGFDAVAGTGWDVSGVTLMIHMFNGAVAFNQDISGWDVSSVLNMSAMFSNTTIFDQDISGWDVSAVTNLNATFGNATGFNQNLGNWDISNVTNMVAFLSGSGLSTANYDATLSGWAAQAVQPNVTLGADGLEYCAEAERQTLTDAPNNWTITDAGLSAGCAVFDDQRVLAGNRQDYVFTGTDFGLADPAFSVKIELLATEGELQNSGAAVAVDDILSVADINAGNLVWSHTFSDQHGVSFSGFVYRVIDDGGVESPSANEMRIDLAAAAVDLVHDGEGWRFMASPAVGETFASLLGPIYTQGIPGSNNPGAAFPNVYRVDQANYQWEVPGHMDEEIDIGEALIVYIFSDDNGDGTPDGFPKTLLSGETWLDLADGFEYTGLDYDPDPAGANPDNFHLIGNPHPVSLDFCQMLIFAASEIAPSAHFWDPSANGGNGDYVSGTCVLPPPIHIAPFQAFWVQTFAVNPELSTGFYLETMEDGFFKEQSKPLQSGIANLNRDQVNPFGEMIHASFEVAGEDGVFTSQAHLLFFDEGTPGTDRFDVPKLDASGLAQRWISLHTLDDSGKPYAFRSLPADFGDQISIPMDIRTTEAGMFELTWELPPSSVYNRSYWLRDNRSGQVVELIEGGKYRFEVDGIVEKRSGKLSLMDTAILPGTREELNEQYTEPRFELLVAAAGVDGLASLGDLPSQVDLSQNYPNPFNPATVIRYELPQAADVRLEVYDMLGRRVATLVDGQITAGRHTVTFDATNLASGIYMYRLQTGATVMSRKLTVIK